MSVNTGKRFDRTQEAWSALADQFTQIAHQFREHHHRVTDGAHQIGAYPPPSVQPAQTRPVPRRSALIWLVVLQLMLIRPALVQAAPTRPATA